MNDFIFQNTTKVYFGKDQLCRLSQEIKPYGKRVLMAYGGGSIKRMGLYDRIMKELRDAGITVLELSGVEPNPRHTTVNRGAAICREAKADAVLAVGGGSTIDCCKAIAAACFYDGDVWDLVKGKAPITKALPIFTVPTIASTGSEMDKSCVISNSETEEKLGMASNLLRPTASFLDPTNTYSVSRFQTACGGFDIMSHFFDLNYFVNTEKYDLQDGVIESVLRTVVKNLPTALQEPDNYQARASLMWAASWALNSFCTSGIQMAPSCHGMEHELSACYDLTHGLGLAILTPRWMEFLLNRDKTVAADFAKFGVNVMGCALEADPEKGAQAAIRALKRFIRSDLELPFTLTEAGIDDSRFAEMAENACRGKAINGYRVLTPQDVEAIYRMCL